MRLLLRWPAVLVILFCMRDEGSLVVVLRRIDLTTSIPSGPEVSLWLVPGDGSPAVVRSAIAISGYECCACIMLVNFM